MELTKEECLQILEQIEDFISENCDMKDVYTLHHLEDHIYEIEKFIKGV